MTGLRAAATLAVALAVVGQRALGTDECGSKTSCAECLEEGEHSFCGWCSPGGILYANGTVGPRCGDERDDPWDCPQHYQTKKCAPEYTCNKTSSQCVVAKPGTPGAFTNQSTCAATCKKPPPPPPPHNHSKHNTTKHHYKCDNSTSQCTQVDTNGTGLFSNLTACNVTCNKPHKHMVPNPLWGWWRGIEISMNFTAGENDFSFGPHVVNITTPAGKSSADVTTFNPPDGIPQIWLTFTSGPDVGKVRKAIYKVGPDGPETNTSIIAMGPPFPTAGLATAPKSFATAMAGGTNNVYFLRTCLPDPGLGCLWFGDNGYIPPPSDAPALTIGEDGSSSAALATHTTLQESKAKQLSEEEPKARRAAPPAPPTVDPCNFQTNCSTCTADFGGRQCGWCTAPVQYGNGTLLGDGDVHCAGFSGDGSALPWECSGLYVRGTCFDHICEVYPNYTVNCRHTKPGEVGTISKDQCATKCKPPAKVYACNHTVGKCQVSPPGHAGGQAQSICAKNCTKPKPKPKPPPMVICNNETLKCEKANSTTPGATSPGACTKVCVKKYLCAPDSNETKLNCTEVKRNEPAYASAQTLSACMAKCKTPPKHNCTPPVLQGTYRGIKISGDGTPFGEWDLKMGYCSAELKNSSGVVWKAKVATGGMAPITFILGDQGPTDTQTRGTDGAPAIGSGEGNTSGVQVIHALYTFENGPQTTRFTLALSAPNGPIPKDWQDVMGATDGGLVLGLAKCINDKPPVPVPGGTYCDPNAQPKQMCPPFAGEPASPCPACAHPPCLCPGNYPPPPPGPPGSQFCHFGSVFGDTPAPPAPAPTNAIDSR